MRHHLRPLFVALALLALGYAFWPFILEHIATARVMLISLKKYCLENLWEGYFIYGGILSTILFAGLPLASAAMLLAGVIYGFWEAFTLVTLCRIMTATAVFLLVRQLMEKDNEPRLKRRKKKQETPYFIREFERHPKIGLILARLAPLPDNVVNCTVAASPITRRDYVLLSLVGMIPFTVVCVWLGNELGTVSQFIRWIK